MKTIKIKPVLVESKAPIKIGSIVKREKSTPWFDDKLNIRIEKLARNKNSNLIWSNDYWKHHQLIFVSDSPGDKINFGDLFYCSDNTNFAHILICSGHSGKDYVKSPSSNEYGYADWPVEYCKKVVAISTKIPNEDFSLKVPLIPDDYIQQYVDDFNSGTVKYVEVEAIKIRKRISILDGKITNVGVWGYSIQPLLSNGYVSIKKGGEICYSSAEISLVLLFLFFCLIGASYFIWPLKIIACIWAAVGIFYIVLRIKHQTYGN